MLGKYLKMKILYALWKEKITYGHMIENTITNIIFAGHGALGKVANLLTKSGLAHCAKKGKKVSFGESIPIGEWEFLTDITYGS
jgi:hypothetical protein